MFIDYNKAWQVKENKMIEVQSDWKNGWTKLFAIDVDIKFTDCDHPGWTFTLELFKLWFFQVSYYDQRHQDQIEKDNECIQK